MPTSFQDTDAVPTLAGREIRENEPSPGLSTISAAIEDIAAGKVILVDDEDRENEETS